MTDFCLVPHVDFGTLPVRRVSAAVTQFRSTALPCTTHLELLYVIRGPTKSLAIPAPTEPLRTDELWCTTCLELFLQVDEKEYFEFNFAPSSQWAAYRFSSYREGMEQLFLRTPPKITMNCEADSLAVSVLLELPDLVQVAAVGLAAVVEEIDGTKSYWTLAHSDGPPDFHNPDCFTARLPAPDNV